MIPYVPQIYHYIFNKWSFSFASMWLTFTDIWGWKVHSKWAKRAGTAGSAYSLDGFSCSIRKLSGCCLKTGWSAKRLTVPALNVSILSLSSEMAAPHLLWFCAGLLIGCLFRAVSSVLAESRSAWRGPTSCFNPRSGKCLIWVSAQTLLRVVAPQTWAAIFWYWCKSMAPLASFTWCRGHP